jgi:lipoate-protein ligase B
MKNCYVSNLGLMDFEDAWQVQSRLVRKVIDDDTANMLLLVQHPHVYTVGRMGSRSDILLDSKELARLGIGVYDADRGGQITYHGPGQLVVYPILSSDVWGGPVKYVRTLEQVIIKTLGSIGFQAHCVAGETGVWMARSNNSYKVASIGIKISKGVTYHGFAINVNPDLSYFDHIVPCGVARGKVTSLSEEMGAPIDINEVTYSLIYHFGQCMSIKMVMSQDIDWPFSP